ncbi:hypothetical protein A9Q92_04875, partial [Methylophaga sp. 42_8_T64]
MLHKLEGHFALKHGLNKKLSRRQFVVGASALMAYSALPWPTRSFAGYESQFTPTLTGKNFALDIDYQNVNFTGKQGIATTVNGSLPAPTLRWKQGERVKIKVNNHLAHD